MRLLEWMIKLLCGSCYCSSCYQVRWAKLSEDYSVFLTRIVITADDLSRYKDKISRCKNVKLRKPIFVDIYI